MSNLRPLDQEFTVPNGINSLNAIVSLDPLYGPFDDAANASTLVPISKRKVGKLLGIYSDSTKTVAEPYMWCKDLAENWAIMRVNDRTSLFQIITLGEIIVDNAALKVTVNVDRIGVNQIRLNGTIFQKGTPNELTFDPIVTPGNYRKDIIEARANSTLFYLKKGVESSNPVQPAVTAGGMFIAEVLVTSTGASTSTPTLAFATPAEVENQTPPTAENNKAISLFGLWKWRDALNYLVLKSNTVAGIMANRLRNNNGKLFFGVSGTVEKEIAYNEPTVTLTSSANMLITDTDANGVDMYGKNAVIMNGSNSFNLQCVTTAKSDFSSVVTKGGIGAITITAGSGATVIGVDYTNILNGAIGSTAKIQRIGNVFYVRIFNA